MALGLTVPQALVENAAAAAHGEVPVIARCNIDMAIAQRQIGFGDHDLGRARLIERARDSGRAGATVGYRLRAP